MKLEAKDGSSFEMTIVDYEFPRPLWDYEKNWLITKHTITNAEGSWTTTESDIYTWEVKDLAGWLERGKSNEKYGDEFYFGEYFPTWFQYTQDDTGRDVLRVFHNPGIEDFLWADFPFEEVDFRAAAAKLREQLEKFPERPTSL